MAYLLDANIFIEAKRRYYGMDFCPAFWDWLQEQNQVGRVFSVEKVGDELAAGGDELFLPPDEAMLGSLSAVAEWVGHQRYHPSAVGDFLQDPDYYLCSFAHAHGYTVVTHEVPSDGTRKIKIPNVCIGMKMKCMSPFEMLRVERARFVLGRVMAV
jgi:hypothetical protein